MARPTCSNCFSTKTRPEVLDPAFAVEIWNCPDCRATLEVLRGSRQVRSCIPYRPTFQPAPVVPMQGQQFKQR
ncbi:hypothetical protein BST81_05110 [Leptolyngbya sp. 'hensonii']|uniref:zinc finger domain-containing protein n=1 Tax=Leptolyngbya sp. 'hensonii' TaxID=1922337 RepID=UPI00094FBDC8|nr:hypothetical protein [Leptolyngbya sp. 'hensonii']OLP19506.1 hypothetical protein BST81_05110 [Leptolyngbya sp. 'hensonii']